MPKKATLKRLVKREKERPFNDEDTEIQVTDTEHVMTYCRDPLERKATDDPVIERVLEPEIHKDILVQDEDNDLGVRTRERYIPKMPLPEEFLSKMNTSDDNIQTKDLEMSVRFYTDAIYRNKELAKVFLMGIVRQLRYWILAQEPRSDIDDDQSHLLYVKDQFIPQLSADFAELARYFTPETDLEPFRRLPLEISMLKKELNNKLDQQKRQREQLEEQGLDPLNLECPQNIDLPSKNIINWILNNPKETQLALDNPEQHDQLIFMAWKELFQSKDVINFLSLQDRLSEKINMDDQKKEALERLFGLLQKSSVKDLSKALEHAQNKNIRAEFLEALNISKETNHLGILQTLQQSYAVRGMQLSGNVISDPERFVQVLVQS